MDKIIIKYKRSRIILNWVLIAFWIALMAFSIYEIFSGQDYTVSTYLWLILGTGYTISSAYYLFKQYITIKGNWLHLNTFPFKKINLKELTDVKKFAGDYTLKTNESQLLIITQIMDESSRKAFESIIDQNFPQKT